MRFLSTRCWTVGALLALLLMAGCRPLYLPPVPATAAPAPRFELAGSSRLELAADGGLELSLVLRRVPEAGWLAIQWFAPDGREATSDAIWLEPSDEGLVRRVTAPPPVGERPREWRAVLSFEGRLVRQFSIELPAREAAP